MNLYVTGAASKRRDKLGIIAEIVGIARGGTLKTQIMYKANLSFAQLTEYVEYMLKTWLLEKLDANGKEVYVATEKGLEFFQKHSELTLMLLEKGRENTEAPKNGVKLPPQSLFRTD